jgi:ferric-dicitrate binding protein FerR (iron transport regulator)/tetratricopeptide (TPR) repeat protein
MTNDEALQLLSARIDGELTPDQDQTLDAWLRDNPDGQAIAEAFRAQHTGLQKSFVERRQAAARTAERVIDQLPPMPASSVSTELPRSRWRHTWSIFPPIAAVIALGFIAVTWLQPEPPTVTIPGKNEVATAPTLNLDGYTDLLVPKAKPPVPTAAVVAVSQSVKTEPGRPMRQMLSDGSMLYMDQNTKVTLVANRELRLESGRIFLDVVSAREDPTKGPFLVKTDKRKIEAMGTKLAVTCTKTADTLDVINGVAKFEGADQLVVAGQRCTTSGSKATIESAPGAAHELGWARDLMVAADVPLVPTGKYDGGALVAVDPYGQEAKLSLVNFHVDVHIEDGFARTTIDQTYFNHEAMQMEGTFYFPLPPDASLSRLAMYVADGEVCNLMEGGMAERDIARQTYEKIRHARKDPALLEWVDGSLFKMRVFPLEPRQEKRLILSYSQKLPASYGKATYRFPAGHTLTFVDKWSFAARVKNGSALHAVSPSHPKMKVEKKDGDLLATDKANKTKVDRDVVLELTDAKSTTAETAHWSSCEFEGANYLMLRYKPELPAQPRRERRDWVFLFEASGARDPLVARAQIEVVRALLNNAEHDDTFAVLTAGTHIHKLSQEPQPVNSVNVDKAIDYLEKTHLIGALNIEQGLIDAEGFLKNGTNPHLVHVGGGVATLGEQRTEKLIERIPQGTRYVGVAVGKRFSPTLMKTAAEKTGGFFTQINPDEPIAWKGFELASTLNTQRLLNINVALEQTAESPDKLAQLPTFLTFSNAISQGEELAAITRLEEAMPTTVKVHGTLNGESFEKTIPVQNVAPNAGYLPRTWAKLEIDRLLAQDALKHRQRITELSKAMYVMTPFTSLLVLENEAMYREHNIDRGRKDHWAMYACPNKVPVVYIPDPNKPLDRNAPELTEQKPHANQVMQTILTRQPMRYLNWGERNSERDEFGLGQPVTFNRGLANADLGVVTTFGAVPASELNGRMVRIEGASPEVIEEVTRLLETDGDKFLAARSHSLAQSTFGYHPMQTRELDRLSGLSRATDLYTSDPNTRMLLLLNDSESLRQIRIEKARFWGTNQPSTLSYERLNAALGVPQLTPLLANPLPTGGPVGAIEGNARESRPTNEFNQWTLGTRLDLPIDSTATHGPFSYVTGGQFTPLGSGEYSEKNQDKELYFRTVPALRVKRILGDETSGPRYYNRPSFSDNRRVFTDLVAYAPGMRTSHADMLAVVEAEAAPRAGLRKGSVDPAARKRIESARQPNWHATTFKNENGDSFVIQHDGQGRYAYERTLDLGLVERVVCDGTTLLHLYPELGIGAKRPVSRFHRAELCDLIPDVLPPADDLAWGVDVKLLDANTVAIVPLEPVGVDEPNAKRKHVELQLVFDGDRLAQRKWLLMPEKKLLGSETYEAAGTLVAFDKDNKETGRDKRERKKVYIADLKLDLSRLVILPLPLRSREITYRKYDLAPHQNLYEGENACFEFLPTEAALELLATEMGFDRGNSRVIDIWHNCFGKKGDNRVGFFTLLQSQGFSPWNQDEFKKLVADAERGQQITPLLRYLALGNEPFAVYCQEQFGLRPGPAVGANFLDNLLSFRAIVNRWQGTPETGRWMRYRANERDQALAFVRRHADDAWGWCALGIVADKGQDKEFRRQIADAWGLIAEKSGLKYHARYEQAVNLLHAGDKVNARATFQKLFDETFEKGFLPPIDHRFREALGSEAWTKHVHNTAAKCLEKKVRPAVVLLAWQCRQLGDPALADDLLELALRDLADDAERINVTLAAVEYLWSIQSFEHADRLVGTLSAMPELQKQPRLWRLSAKLAEKRGRTLRQFECLEAALDREYARMPEVFSVEPVRNDYRSLLNHYQWLAEASRSLDVGPPADLLTRTIKTADRWRSLDPEVTEACDTTAKILRLVGGKEAEALAWDYLTTPLAMTPNESDPWLGLATSATREGNLELADRCYDAAFAAEPTNAQILWDRAKLLERRGEIARSRELMAQLSNTEWQPRFEGLKSQAKSALQGK